MAGELGQLGPAWCPPGCLPCPSSWVLHLPALWPDLLDAGGPRDSWLGESIAGRGEVSEGKPHQLYSSPGDPATCLGLPDAS